MKDNDQSRVIAEGEAAAATPIWQKSTTMTAEIERFTVGRDRQLDLYLAESDVIGSMAHITMLQSIGLLTADELQALLAELRHILGDIRQGRFTIEEGVEDVHSEVELLLTRRLGDVGKKIHSGRSRNDQVLLDLKLWTRRQLREVAGLVNDLFDQLQAQSERYSDVLMPGYTHLQVAMPSSFGLWFGAYAESLTDDMLFLQAAYRMVNRNPLGSAAGYGSSFPLDRQMTTDLLGFDTMAYNVVYAQMGRGKMERNVAFALASVAGTIAKLAFDACMFNSQNFGFLKLPAECTTGSSIMPHKKNPDVFELTRAKCNKLQALPQQVTLIMNNLPSGYFRDLQIIKEVFLPAFDELKDCLRMCAYIIPRIEVNRHILDDPRYDLMFSVEEVNRLAAAGTPFRDAYRQVGLDIEAGHFTPTKEVHHTHAGSIGNLCNDRIAALMDAILADFHFERVDEAEAKLTGC
ncbi:MAG: argininosuccinate lyase [Bacteroidaceae bacterium]|nr:argininosuccinate lyase [Bacteroidaceae bacterium]